MKGYYENCFICDEKTDQKLMVLNSNCEYCNKKSTHVHPYCKTCQDKNHDIEKNKKKDVRPKKKFRNK
jgi:hypothetical protein